ncbi:MAG: substrate-binding domain-containing protein [Burkholderiaceae bacterium]
MNRRMPPKLTDVACAAGVSLSTASRALSSPGLVHADTLQRVRRAASRLGYVPHGAARALASQRTRTIGAVFPPVDNPTFAVGTHALARELASAGYTLLLASHDYDAEAEFDAVRRLVERGVDGLVLVGIQHCRGMASFLRHAGIPVEMTWLYDESGRWHSVGASHRAASAAMAEYLLGLGHREFAVIAGQVSVNDRARERLEGVRDMLAGNGVSLAETRVIELPFSFESGRNGLARLLRDSPGFTALVCGNDLVAIGAMNTARERGIEVPHALSIVGFDDIAMASEVCPALTTIHLPSAEIGVRAARRLLARLEGEWVARGERLPAPLVVRGTSAPPIVVEPRVRRVASGRRRAAGSRTSA